MKTETKTTIDFNEEEWEMIKALKKLMGMRTNAPIIRMGIKALYNEKFKKNKKGGNKNGKMD